MMLTGAVPFGGVSNDDIIKAILTKTGDPKKLASKLRRIMASMQLSEDCIDFILALMTVDDKARPTAAAAAQHPWLNQTTDPNDDTSPAPARLSSTTGVEGLELVRNLKQFKQHSKIKQSALLAISFRLGSEELSKLNASFLEIDKDHDGTISYEEFDDMMRTNGIESVKEVRWLANFDHQLCSYASCNIRNVFLRVMY